MDSLHNKPEQETVVFNTLASLKHKKTVGPIERAMLNTTPPKAEPKQALDKLFEVENELGLHYDEKPKQEPVALVISGALVKSELPENYTGHLYTTPLKREWVGLTAEEAAECWTTSATQTWKNFEAKLKEKNN